MTQIIDQCEACGSPNVEWRKEEGFFKGTQRYRHCRQCLGEFRGNLSLSTWIFFAIALAAAVWGWVAVIAPNAR
jgi:hypothetical protein